MSQRSDLAVIVRRQDGLITRRQAIHAGITADALRGLRARGEWITVLPQVYRVVESHLTPESRVRAVSRTTAITLRTGSAPTGSSRTH